MSPQEASLSGLSAFVFICISGSHCHSALECHLSAVTKENPYEAIPGWSCHLLILPPFLSCIITSRRGGQGLCHLCSLAVTAPGDGDLQVNSRYLPLTFLVLRHNSLPYHHVTCKPLNHKFIKILSIFQISKARCRQNGLQEVPGVQGEELAFPTTPHLLYSVTRSALPSRCILMLGSEYMVSAGCVCCQCFSGVAYCHLLLEKSSQHCKITMRSGT